MNSLFTNFTDIYTELIKYINAETKLILGISGGADSMFLFHLLKYFYELNNFTLKNIIITHYNHKYRKESDEEAEYLKKFFQNYNFQYEEYTGTNYTENHFRKARYIFFGNIINKFTNNKYLLLGHNLTDRIETTILNMIRGADLTGFINMKFFGEKIIQNQEIKIIRPLINISKENILIFCNKLQLKYFEDISNLDSNFSKRNFIRQQIIQKINKLSLKNVNADNKFFLSWQKLYHYLEEIPNANNIKLLAIKISQFWGAEWGYEIIGNISALSDVVHIFQILGIYQNINKGTINEFFKFFKQIHGKYKLYQGVYFFKIYQKLYVIKAAVNFWQKRLALVKKINTIGIYKFGDFEININNERDIGGILRFPRTSDFVGSKKLSKIFINNKIPIYWRPFIPILEYQGEIKYLNLILN